MVREVSELIMFQSCRIKSNIMMHGCRQVHLLKQRKSVPYCIGYSLQNLACNRTAELYISSNTYVVFYFIETKLFLIYRLENQRMMANTLSTDRLQEKE